jgi:transposase
MQTKQQTGHEGKASFEQQLQAVAAKYQQLLQEEKASFEQQLQAVAAKYEQQLQEEKASFEQQLQAMQAHSQQQLQKGKASFEEQLQAVEAKYEQQIQDALARISELEGRLKKDSHNSSKPPSSDGLRRKTHSLRKPSGKKSGGQEGHSGQTLRFAETADLISTHRPQHCQECGTCLQEMAGRVVESRQVHDLPQIRLQVTQHQVEEICCPHCCAVTRGSFPPDVSAPVQYGPRVRGWAVYLNQYELVPMERTRQILMQGLGCSISQGTLTNWVQLASRRLQQTYDTIKQFVIASRLIHGDETGLHINKMLHWLHTASTRFLTYLAWHRKRGKLAMDAIGILPAYQGRIMRDRLSSYDQYACEQSICGAHLLRDLTRVFEQFKQKWARTMLRVLVAINHVACSFRSLGATCVPKEIRDRWVARYFHVLALGYAAQPPPVPRPPGKRGRPPQTDAKNLLDALLQRAHQVLAFLDDLAIPFTNNQAERDLRMVKVQQKISGTFRSDDGATAFCRIRSYLSTLHKQGRPLLEALVAVFLGHPFPIALSLG